MGNSNLTKNAYIPVIFFPEMPQKWTEKQSLRFWPEPNWQAIGRDDNLLSRQLQHNTNHENRENKHIQEKKLFLQKNADHCAYYQHFPSGPY